MTARRLAGATACAVLVPLLSALPPAPPLDTPGPGAIAAGAVVPAAQQADASIPVRSTRLERRDASAGLTSALSAVARADQGAHWVGWSVPAAATRDRRPGWHEGEVGRCVLDDEGGIRHDGGFNGSATGLVVLMRREAGRVTRVAFADQRCTVEAGSRPVYWLGGVVPAQSVQVLAGLAADAAAGGGEDRPQKQALVALALHRDPAADAALNGFVAAGQPRELRRDAAFWLGASRGEAGAAAIERLARQDEDDDFREHLTFVLTLVGERGVDRLLELARGDRSAAVRGQALFWLGQKAGQRAVSALDRAVAEDPDREVRKKAVFSLSQLPRDEGIPKLISVARTHRDPEVRKQAMFWLGQSGDARAVAFFEDVLRK